MRIVMRTNTYAPHVGGVARSVEAFAREYRRRGHQVLVVCPEFENAPKHEPDVVRVPAIQRFNGSDFSLVLMTPRWLRAEIEEFAPEIIHSHHPFFLGATAVRLAGAGFDAHVVAGVSVPMKRWLGKGAYVLSTLHQLLVFNFPTYEVLTDNTPRHAASVIVTIVRHYGGRFICAPQASLESGTLHVCLFERSGRRAAIGYALALFTGRLPQLATFRMIEARRVEIRGRPGEPVQGDGDIIGKLDVAIEVLPNALDLIYPPPRAGTAFSPT